MKVYPSNLLLNRSCYQFIILHVVLTPTPHKRPYFRQRSLGLPNRCRPKDKKDNHLG